jgi:hypothetical protein
VTDEEWEKQRARAVAAAFQTGRPVFADTDGALRYADGAREEVPPGVGSATSVDAEFSGFFRSIGYVVERNGKIATGERWHEILDEGRLVCQVKTGTPLAEFLADLPHLVEGEPGVGPTDYWCACDDDEKLRALLARARSARRLTPDG